MISPLLDLHRPGPVTLVLALALAAGGCSEPAPPFEGAANELLERRPDAVHDQPGVLAAGPEDPFGDRALEGWYRVTQPAVKDGEERPAGTLLHARTEQARAVLRLPASAPRDRTLELLLWSPDATAEEHPPVTVTLNGTAPGWRLPLSPVPTTERIEVGAASWRAGDNELAFEVERKGNLWPRVNLARVRYDEPREVRADPEAGTLSLSPGTGVSYVVETRGPARLELEAGGPAGARLLVRTRAAAPQEAGAPAEAEGGRDAGSSRALTVPAAGLLSAELPLPAGVEPLEVELSFGEAAAPLEVARLTVREARPAPRPSVVFVSVDTFAARHLATYGYGRETTPNLDALRSEAVLFDRCYVNAPWTMPSYMSVLSGLYPQAHKQRGVVQRADADSLAAFSSWQLAESRWTMAETFRGLGYRTAAFVDTQWLYPLFRFDQGFDSYDVEAAKITFTEPLGGVALIHYKLANDWLDAGRPGQPFFLFVHTLDAHGPYVPEPPFRDHFHRDPPPGGWVQVPSNSAFQTYRAIPAWMAVTIGLDPAHVPEHMPVEPLVDRYDETLLKTDAYLGKILDELRSRGLYDDAVLVVTGDHGESFDHDFYGHGTMWEDVLRVPFLIRLPGGAHGGMHVPDPVELVDLYPTLRELVGLAPLPGAHGRSLLPLLSGTPAAPRVLYGSEGHCEQYYVTDGRWKLVVEYPGRQSQATSLLTHPEAQAWVAEHFPELVGVPLTKARYDAVARTPGFDAQIAELRRVLDGPFVRLADLAADPDERHDVAAEHPDVVARLQAALERERGREDAARLHGQSRTNVQGLDAAGLGALGYVDGGDGDGDGE